MQAYCCRRVPTIYRKPYTQPNNEDFLKTRENVESYINNLYTSLPAPAQYGIGVRGEEVNSDNILSEKYDMRLNGENNQFSGSDDWNKGYKNLRMVNYFFIITQFPKWTKRTKCFH